MVAQATLRVVQLVAAKAKVQQNTIGLRRQLAHPALAAGHAVLQHRPGQHFGNRVISRAHQVQAVTKFLHQRCAAHQRAAVPVQSHHFGTALQKPTGVATPAQRAIHQQFTGGRLQRRHHLVKHHGYMHGLRRTARL